MPGRVCIFCGGAVSSKEHLFAEWILNSLGVRARRRRQTLVDGVAREFVGPMEIRCLCESCNNGWMSDIEVSAKPVMEPMMHDRGHRLTPDDQLRLAVWAAKTAMVGEGTKPGKLRRFFAQEDREAMRNERTIPDGTVVQIGRYYAPAGQHFASTDITWRIGDVIEGMNGNVTTMVVGHLVVQVVSARLEIATNAAPTVSLPVRAVADWDSLLLDVWPHGQPFDWPPVQSFNGRVRDSNFISNLHDRWKVTQPLERSVVHGSISTSDKSPNHS